MTDNVLESLALEEAKFVRCAGGRDSHFFSVGETEATSFVHPGRYPKASTRCGGFHTHNDDGRGRGPNRWNP